MPKAPPKQKTPKGAEIPVPKRKDFYANLDKVVKAPSGAGKTTTKPPQQD